MESLIRAPTLKLSAQSFSVSIVHNSQELTSHHLIPGNAAEVKVHTWLGPINSVPSLIEAVKPMVEHQSRQTGLDLLQK